MFKNRYFIMGLGCGMIIGVLLLQLIWTGQNMTPTLSKEQLEQEAKRQGYELVLPDNNLQEGLVPSTEGDEDNPAVGTVDETVQGGESQQDEAMQEKPSGEETEVHEKDTKQVRIQPKMTSSQIASQLADLGIIDNAEEFEAYIKLKQKQTLLRAGYFIFEVPSTYEQALTTLTSPPNG